jgi:hypothetical protein
VALRRPRWCPTDCPPRQSPPPAARVAACTTKVTELAEALPHHDRTAGLIDRTARASALRSGSERSTRPLKAQLSRAAAWTIRLPSVSAAPTPRPRPRSDRPPTAPRRRWRPAATNPPASPVRHPPHQQPRKCTLDTSATDTQPDAAS